ncbi:unnamed protein product [Bursaphelenchus xylophilus]|uniref:(pine wood nematode) hypothetical protein n=1 Tax=Bursaphelenchus xylophilus TaxID=6326 RepID=A0A1I7S7Q3_BURXY|nr:unnamed protein product [Bursaphelenchus xylophilus]CAG9086852.1 unnamed protein product [Bursaphelenchus xylophilus]
MELFFEVLREKTHIMADVRENGTVADIKQIIAGVMQRPVAEITLKKSRGAQLTDWETISDEKALVDLGFTQKNAKPDDPAILVFLLPEDGGRVNITPLSTPPPLPEAMQHSEMNVD